MSNEEKILQVLQSMESQMTSMQSQMDGLDTKVNKIDSQMTSIQSQLQEHSHILRALEHSSQEHKALLDQLDHRVAIVEGRTENIEKNRFTFQVSSYDRACNG